MTDRKQVTESNEEQTHVYFVNTEDPPLKTKHICYFTEGDGREFVLYEVVEEYFPHPDAPGYAMVQCFKVYRRDEQKITSYKSGPLIQSWAMEKTLKMLYPVAFSEAQK